MFHVNYTHLFITIHFESEKKYTQSIANEEKKKLK